MFLNVLKNNMNNFLQTCSYPTKGLATYIIGLVISCVSYYSSLGTVSLSCYMILLALSLSIIVLFVYLFFRRCGEPAAECVFSNFSLLLTEEPPEEPEVINMGVLFGEDKLNGGSEGKEEDDEASIDLDDHLYFPSEQREIDISKNIRDMVHVEITINAICNPSCQGLCLKCGLNLNTGSCVCRKEKLMEKGYGPLGNLRKQMQRK